jgi:hypothetical protein
MLFDTTTIRCTDHVLCELTGKAVFVVGFALKIGENIE